MDYERILKKKEIYNKHIDRVPIEQREKFYRNFEINFTHNSTAIEGNTLSLIETKLLIEDKISVGGKSLREIYEVINNHKAFEYVKKSVNKNITLDENIVKDIHSIINENILIGGIYRNEPVRIGGASHKPPVGQEMYMQIKNFFSELPYKYTDNPIDLSSYTHAEFVRIHPFVDGNGRTSRQIMNYQLMINNFPPVSISVKDRLEYYLHLDKYATTGDLSDFSNMVSKLVEEQLDEYIELIQYNS